KTITPKIAKPPKIKGKNLKIELRCGVAGFTLLAAGAAGAAGLGAPPLDGGGGAGGKEPALATGRPGTGGAGGKLGA
ncbi:MAG: hypothetical protein JNK33_06300, partial [Candidatus Doudnabacteria bacterium]|nr:hypothetical protein [Candidatus Doudnabacteria bacterium]